MPEWRPRSILPAMATLEDVCRELRLLYAHQAMLVQKVDALFYHEVTDIVLSSKDERAAKTFGLLRQGALDTRTQAKLTKLADTLDEVHGLTRSLAAHAATCTRHGEAAMFAALAIDAQAFFFRPDEPVTQNVAQTSSFWGQPLAKPTHPSNLGEHKVYAYPPADM